MKARRGWKEVFEVMKVKDLHPRILYPAKLSFRMEGQIKCFPVKGVCHHQTLITGNVKGTYLRNRRSKTMTSTMTTNSQLSTTEPKKMKTKTKKTTRTGTESEMEITWRVFSGEGEGKNGGTGTGNKKHNW